MPTDEEPCRPPDDLLAQAIELVLRHDTVTISLLQRHLRLSYSSSSHLMALMEGRFVQPLDEKVCAMSSGQPGRRRLNRASPSRPRNW